MFTGKTPVLEFLFNKVVGLENIFPAKIISQLK